jgi:hypothetical protein
MLPAGKPERMERHVSFWKNLFAGGAVAAASPAATAEHNGFAISADPFSNGGQFQVAGTISKEINGERKDHKFIRADSFGSREEAATFTLIKAKQIIDQQGDRMFV